MIIQNEKLFVLQTQKTTYAFEILESGLPQHLYYGKRIRIEDPDFLRQKRVFPQGNMNSYSAEYPALCPENLCLEFSAYGKGDVREPMIELIHRDGNRTCSFHYDSARILNGPIPLQTLPHAHEGDCEENDQQVQTLEVTYKELNYDLIMHMYYCVFEHSDVITRCVVLKNEGTDSVTVNRLLSMQIDLDRSDLEMTSFHGSWAREMEKYTQSVRGGMVSSGSVCGCSSSRSNPFVMLHPAKTEEEHGCCYGFNLTYSGNHIECAMPTVFGKTRFLTGIHPADFCWELFPGDTLEAPEAVMTFSEEGFTGMSHNMHHFVREHVVRGIWAKKERPVLLNSWEASYFDINEAKLLKLAAAAKEVGIELFVMDDGWFGKRNDDTSSLGDWYVNQKKLPGGLSRLGQKINALGLDFGIWVEPEMVNTDSDLYRSHPEWVMEVPGQDHSEGRNQRILDLCCKEVQDYVIESMKEVFGSAKISYVKWDMNRIFSDVFSQNLPRERQGEVAHRYMIGLYRIMKELTEAFPEILFEGCAAGGNRFDLGILSFFPQIWGSDNTDAMCRRVIQTNYSYGYPANTVTAHVSSCPNHQTLRVTPIETRFAVASFGVLGYECNLVDLSKADRLRIKNQVSLYKKYRKLLQLGTFYRGNCGSAENYFYGTNEKAVSVFCTVSDDRKSAYVAMVQGMTEPNPPDLRVKVPGLCPELKYHFYHEAERYDLLEFGDLINTAAPIHIKQDSLVHKTIAKFVSMPGESEDYHVYGDALSASGVVIKAAFGGTGYDDRVRFFPDYASRIYFVEADPVVEEGTVLLEEKH